MVVLDPEQVPDVVDDAVLVADAQRGSVEAFAELYARHHPRIVRHCRNRIGGDEAADAAQETFLRAWRALGTFGGDGRFGPWLRTIATNVCIDVLRRRGRSVPVAEVTAVSIDEPELGALTLHTEAMTEALARLSDRHRAVLQLREWEGWSYERIADHEQLDLSAVKSLLWRARQSLRREFLLVSAQGRLSALGGLLGLGRLRDALSQLGAAGTAAGAAAVAATVAVPVLVAGPAAPPPEVAFVPPAAVTTTVPPPAPQPVVLSRPAPTTTAPPASTTTAPPPVQSEEPTVDRAAQREQEAADREAAKAARDADREAERREREDAKAAREGAREAEEADREAAKLAREAAREAETAEREAAKDARQAEREAEKAERKGA